MGVDSVDDMLTLGSNRTFMELKYVTIKITAAKQGCSNRTFMELKLT